jgi:hypothetical protein
MKKYLIISAALGLAFAFPAFASTQIVITSTASTTWTVPSDWNSASNNIQAIGAGGKGANSTASANSGAGGGGGEFREIINASLTPGSTVNINIPSGGAGASASGTWLEDNTNSLIIKAINGSNGSGTTAGSGGTGGVGSALNYAGGPGASNAATSVNNQFASSSNIDYSTTTGSIYVSIPGY